MAQFNFRTENNADAAIFYLEGKLDKVTTIQYEPLILAEAEKASKLILDCSELTYVSSAGLRTLLKLRQMKEEKGTMVLRNINTDIMNILDMTGFASFMEIEKL